MAVCSFNFATTAIPRIPYGLPAIVEEDFVSTVPVATRCTATKSLTIGALISLSALAAACSKANGSPAPPAPIIQCALATPVQEVSRVSELPTEIRKLLPPIADIGAPFNATDNVSDPALPFRRLIRAGYRGDDWFVWYERGGVGYSLQIVMVRIPPGGGEVTVLVNATTIPPRSDTLCGITDGVYAGRIPPYPQGAEPAGTSY
jgi:hypothetical protein